MRAKAKSNPSKRKVRKLLVVSSRGTITLPKDFRKNVSFLMAEHRDDGVIELRPQGTIDQDQTWFWTERWQRMEREADADIKAGRVLHAKHVDEFIAKLERD